MHTPDDDFGDDLYSDADLADLESTVPPALPEGTCTECHGRGWVEGERLGGQFERIACCECDAEPELDEPAGTDASHDPATGIALYGEI